MELLSEPVLVKLAYAFEQAQGTGSTGFYSYTGLIILPVYSGLLRVNPESLL